MLRNIFYLFAVVNVVFGALFLFIPETLGTTYGGKMDATAITVARYFGSVVLPLGYLGWVLATAEASALKLAAIRTFAVTPVLGAIVTLLALSAGVINAGGAVFNLVLYAIFVMGFGYYGFVKAESA